MATVSKDSLAQFWGQTLPKIVPFQPENEQQRKILELVEQSVVKKTIPPRPHPVAPPPPPRPRFTLTIDVFPIDEPSDTPVVERSVEQLTSLLHHPERVDEQFRILLHPWLIDLSFQVTADLFGVVVELMNTYPSSFFRHCFLPWIHQHVDGHFFSNLFEHLQRRADQNQLCLHLSEDLTCPWNRMELMLISRWFERKDFFFSRELFQLLPEKCVRSAEIFADCLVFAKVLHKVLIKSNEHEQMITDEQRAALKRAIALNTTILSDILMDLLD